jgi:hypothetical protein
MLIRKTRWRPGMKSTQRSGPKRTTARERHQVRCNSTPDPDADLSPLKQSIQTLADAR